LNYVEVPLNFVFNANSPAGKFFAGAGPCFSLGVSGKDKMTPGGQTATQDVKFGSGEEDDIKAFEAGVNFLAGYQFKGDFQVAANYNAGLSNLADNDPQEPVKAKYHNRYFGIRIGYMFTGKKK
jgi:Outer membrane protein beta-barrel domain